MGACAYVTADLHFGFLARASFSEFVNQGAHNSPLIQKFFFAAYTTSCSKGGSLAQAALNFNFQGIQIVDMPYALATRNVSLSALFPCNAYTTPSIEMRDKRDTVQVLAEKLGCLGDRNSSEELEHRLCGENRVADSNDAGYHELTKEVTVAFA